MATLTGSGSILRKRPELFSDFRRDFAISPLNNDIFRVTNEASINQSLENLIRTNKGECLLDMNKGCDIERHLFKNISPATLILMKQTIRSTIVQYEKRINLIEVDVTADVDGHEVTVTIFYNINESPEPLSLSVIVKRVR